MEDEPTREELVAEYQNFAKKSLGFEFRDIDLLINALTHRSYVNEHRRSHLEHNERLEFLGDAILEMTTSDFLYRNFEEPEGTMTSWRSALVRTESLASAAVRLGYEPLVRVSRGERRSNERSHTSVLADCFEAVIAAIYLDQGYQCAKKFIYDNILSHMEEIIHDDSWRDPKSYLQEMTQKFEETTPQYRTMKEEGPDHNKTFTVGLYIRGRLRAVGIGHSKQDAQAIAARQGVKYYKDQIAAGILSTEE